jgi:hypothetical protein
MVQNVDYEIPYLRKQLAKSNQQITDADRKHADYLRSAASCAAGFKQECAKQGIQGAAVQQELLQLVAEVGPAQCTLAAPLPDTSAASET